MQRTVALLPESISELCLVRIGLQVRGLRALLYAMRLSRMIDRSTAEAIASGAGLLHSERFRVSRGHYGILQYWRSFDDLDAWSHRPPHTEWWRDVVATQRTRGGLGIYHETFLVPRDRVESIYLGCSPVGLLAFGTSADPVGPLTTSRGRLGRLRSPSE